MVPCKIIAIAGARGVGKTTLLKHLQKEYILAGIPSFTTRSSREGDESLFRYVTLKVFGEMNLDNEFLWIKENRGALYGTRKTDIEKALLQNDCSIMNITHDCFEPLYNFVHLSGGTIDDIRLLYIESPPDEVLKQRLKKQGRSVHMIKQDIAECKKYAAEVVQIELPIYFLHNEVDLSVFFLEAEEYILNGL